MAETALGHALDLARSPALAAHLRKRPLPPEVLTVIRLAGGCPDTLAGAVRTTRWEPGALRAAAELYCQRVLLFPEADHRRVLGVGDAATRDEMRLHMRALMMWLHPDRARAGWEAAFAGRVIGAWRALDRPAPPPPQAAEPPRGGPRRQERGRQLPRHREPRPRSREQYKPAWIAREIAPAGTGPRAARTRPGAGRPRLRIWISGGLAVLGLLLPDAVFEAVIREPTLQALTAISVAVAGAMPAADAE